MIFLELRIPKIDGADALVRIKSMDKLGPVPVIVCSGSSIIMGEEDVIRENAVHYLVKSSSQGALIETLKLLFENKQDTFIIALIQYE